MLVSELHPVRATEAEVVHPAGHDHDRIAKPIAFNAHLILRDAQPFDTTLGMLNHHSYRLSIWL